MDSDSIKGIVNHTFVLQLLTKGTEQLRRIFRERWDILRTINLDFTEWKNDELSGKELIKLCNSVQSNKKGKVFTLDQSIFKKFKEGKIDFWDITVSNSAIQVVSAAICNLGISTNKKEDKLISDLRVVRNDVVHEKDSKLTEAQFVKYWDRVERVV
uniref:RiboL-PSP-HEPN domain-containing protein n=1 Tax=Panagrolaimus sp. PS1159 TaxID=55785 RepID=A0AC35GQI8_9BILA